MATYLVTGGAGFIGSNIVEQLLRRGDHVRVLDDFSTGRRENLAAAGRWATDGGGSFELIEGDIRDPGLCRDSTRGVQFVLHQAAMGSVPRSVEEPLRTHQVNALGTLHLLLAARDEQVQRFVLASSSSVYGESETLPKVETMPNAPISPYALQKLTAETYTLQFYKLYGLPTVALRYFNVFGPRQNPEGEYAAVIPRFIDAIRGGDVPTIYGDGEQTRDFTHVDNAVRANLLACEAGRNALGLAYNVGAGDRFSLNEVVRLLAGFAGREIEPHHAEARAGDVRHSLAAIDRAADLLGYRPEVSFGEGLERLWNEGDGSPEG